MRNLYSLIQQIKEKLPKDYSIDDLAESIEFSSPEMIGYWWEQSQQFINKIMPSNPKELQEWQKDVLEIWTGRSF
jgi:hypothetical protein